MNKISVIAAEFLGTATLVFVACGVAVYSTGNPVAAALAFGLVVVAMAYTIGGISGAHINPAVSFGACLAGRMPFKDFILYAAAQTAGAAAGGALLYAVYLLKGGTGWATGAMGENLFASAEAVGQSAAALGFLIETALTFVFVLTILGVTSKKEHAGIAGIVIGLTLTLVHLLGIPFTGTSVNPARSIGSAIFAGGEALSQVWLFIAAPLAGAALAAVAARCLFKPEGK